MNGRFFADRGASALSKLLAICADSVGTAADGHCCVESGSDEGGGDKTGLALVDAPALLSWYIWSSFPVSPTKTRILYWPGSCGGEGMVPAFVCCFICCFFFILSGSGIRVGQRVTSCLPQRRAALSVYASGGHVAAPHQCLSLWRDRVHKVEHAIIRSCRLRRCFWECKLRLLHACKSLHSSRLSEVPGDCLSDAFNGCTFRREP